MPRWNSSTLLLPHPGGWLWRPHARADGFGARWDAWLLEEQQPFLAPRGARAAGLDARLPLAVARLRVSVVDWELALPTPDAPGLKKWRPRVCMHVFEHGWAATPSYYSDYSYYSAYSHYSHHFQYSHYSHYSYHPYHS